MEKLNMGIAAIRANGKLQQAIDSHAPMVDSVAELHYSHENDHCSV